MKKIYFFPLIAAILLSVTIWWNRNESKLPVDKGRTIKAGFNKPESSTVTLAAAGDVIMHMPIVNSATTSDGVYDFRPIFSEIRPDLTRADIAVAVLETQLAGLERGYSGYPRFNSPASIADALKWSGIGLVFTAHNHSLDQGVDGLKATLSYLDQINLPYVGCGTSSEQKRYRLVEIKGIKLAFLSYTTMLNEQKTLIGQEWAVNSYDRRKITADIAEVRQAGADCIITALHTGIEYQREPSLDQQKTVDWLIRSGVDIILGSHVHVIQPVEYREFYNSDTGDTRDCFIAYSLGNLLSNQRWQYSDYGLLMNLKLQKKLGEPGVRIVETNYDPLWVHRYIEQGKPHYRIKKLTGPEYFGVDPNVDQVAKERMKVVWYEMTELFNCWTKNMILEENKSFPPFNEEGLTTPPAVQMVE